MEVRVADTADELGAMAAREIAISLRRRLEQQSRLRMVFAAAPSQSAMLAALRQEPQIDWTRITAFHMDEYLGLPEDAPQRFGNWLEREFFHDVPVGEVHLMQPGDDPARTCRTYAAKLKEAPIDVVLLGIGTNGHLAFNDPPADLQDPLTVKVVTLDATCREQQVFDGCFPTLEDVPREAMTLTVPALLAAKEIFGCVPGKHKSSAVRAMLEDTVSGLCPATALRTHPQCMMFLDRASSIRSRIHAGA
jgi:glucosamine-6-phosphate deaminase